MDPCHWRNALVWPPRQTPPREPLLFLREEPLRGDRGVVLAAVRESGLALRWASAALRADVEVASVAVEQDGRALEFVGEALQKEIGLGEGGNHSQKGGQWT